MAITNVKRYCMEMEISEISKLDWTCSSEIPIHGIPWKVEVCKKGTDANHSLGVYLYCTNKDKSPDWSLWGSASFKLLPFGDDVNAIELHTQPNVFNSSGVGRGFDNFIKWNDLFDQDKKYVKDDTINLEVKITAENPNDPNRSRMNLECLHKCRDDEFALIRLKVNNVMNLMAVRSPPFILRGLPWDIQISKMRSSHLGVLLRLNKDPGNVPSKMSMSIKLVSSKEGVQPIKECIDKQYQYLKGSTTIGILSWDELVKPENGFVNDNSITLEIEIDTGKPDANEMPAAKRAKLNPDNEIKTPQMECPICLKCIGSQDLSVTPCGHLFCLECITDAVKGRAVCPSCNKSVPLKSLKRLYLPVVN